MTTNRIWDTSNIWTEEMISRIADSAADDAVNYLKNQSSPSKKDHTPVNTEYYSHKFLGLDDRAKKALAKAYLIRREPYTNPEWVDAYADWLSATGNKYHDKHDGLKDFKTMANYYYTRIKSGKGDVIKKDYNSIKAVVEKNIRRQCDANFEG